MTKINNLIKFRTFLVMYFITILCSSLYYLQKVRNLIELDDMKDHCSLSRGPIVLFMVIVKHNITSNFLFCFIWRYIHFEL